MEQNDVLKAVMHDEYEEYIVNTDVQLKDRNTLEIYLPQFASAYFIVKSGFRGFYYIIYENGEFEDRDIRYLSANEVKSYFNKFPEMEKVKDSIYKFIDN